MSVSRSAYYWLKHRATNREKADEELAKRIHTTFKKSRKTYGHRRVKQALKQNFHVAVPRQVLVGDITYIPTEEGWLHLATVDDLLSKKDVGWALGVFLAI